MTNRRAFIQAAAISAVTLVAGCARNTLKSKAKARVVVVGGGYAGATAAKYIRLWSAGNIHVTVVEPNPHFISCPLSNLVLGGHKTLSDLSFSYAGLAGNHGIDWITDSVLEVNPERRMLKLGRGELSYDRLVIAPGIDFIYDNLPGLANIQSQAIIPHAWKAGAQTLLLRKQLESMPDGGVCVMTIPLAAYRCPPGPYERACQIASYFKTHKPNSKLIVLDANPEIVSKKGLFAKVFKDLYDGTLDYRPNVGLQDISAKEMMIKTEFENLRGDVINVIPPQRAGKLAQTMQLINADGRWCDVDFLTYESKVVANVHVIGDAVFSGLPKSAHMATSQAKVCASAIVALLRNEVPDSAPVFANTCYSFIDGKQAMHVAHVYRYDVAKKTMVAAEGGGTSIAPSVAEGQYAESWARNIWTDTLT